MVAIALPTTTAPARRRRPLPSAGAGRAHHPVLAVVPPRPARVRPLASIVLAAVLGLAVVGVAAFLALSPAPAPGATSAPAATHVVGEGESMWSIAVDHAPAGEAATYVEVLTEANGTARVVPGQAIRLPAP
jgi:hypothetical protein